jgi:cytochrome c biogenesis protein CcmG/thiol:disulfide interchange protein DsbE
MTTSRFLPLAALLFVLGAGTVFAAPLDPGAMAPDWKLQNLDGKTVQLSDFKGKVVVLDFWATWCPPCRAEIPDFIALQNQYKDKGLVVIGVSLDQGGPGVVSSFAKTQGMNYSVVMGTDDVAAQYGDIQAIPTTFVIDRSGKVVAKHEGETDKGTFEDEIKKLL